MTKFTRVDGPYYIDLNAPTLLAYQRTGSDGKTEWAVWCPHCRQWHAHHPGFGHRLAGCDDESSPYHGTGYNLTLAGNFDERHEVVDVSPMENVPVGV